MSDHLLALGLFVFGTDRLTHQELARRCSWRHATSERYGDLPASQFLGPAGDEITLSGVLVPEIAGSYSDIATLREMGASGEIYPLITGDGEVLGDFRILAVDDRWRTLVKGGRGRAVDFAIDLAQATS